MKITHLAFAAMAAFACAQSYAADVVNPFDPASAKNRPTKGATPATRPAPPVGAPVAPLPMPLLPPVLPPPLPAPRVQGPVPASTTPESVEAGDKKKPKESQLESTAATCKLEAKSASVAAPAYGGLVSVTLVGGSKSCVSAVMVEQPWLEVQELTEPGAIRIAVDANDSATPRQSNIIIANAGRSVTVTLVQEGRTSRAR